jgi:N-acetylmuramoyl-L-alanine amidase
MKTPLIHCLLWALIAGVAHANPVRSVPTRPVAGSKSSDTAATNIVVPITMGKVPEYVKIETFAKSYGLTHSWLIPQRRVLLKSAEHHLEIEAGSREMRFNGYKVFLGDVARINDGAFCISRVDGERLLAGLLQPEAAGPQQVKRIVIDPGHGGSDMGTQNVKLQLDEKVFALDVSVRLRALLKAKGYEVSMTRESDVAVGKAERALFANVAKADLFISVHFNASPAVDDRKTSGTEVFTFAPQFQRSTDSWGPGQADDRELQPAPVNRFDIASVACAHAIQVALLKSLKTVDRGQKIAHWGALRGLNCPGVLVEAGFLSHPIEGKKIATPGYRQQIAEAIADGVDAYAAAGVAAKN